MNKVFEERLAGFGESKPILPLKEAGQIAQGNSCRKDWKEVCSIAKEDEVYIIGNPPYQGYSKQVSEQKKDMAITFSGVKNYKKLDYIACWFYKATQYISNTNCKYAFVTTNSITQGEQVALLWPLILNSAQEIFFAYQSFIWNNNAKGKAQVAVVIIGIRNLSNENKHIYYGNIKQTVKNISSYLTNYNNLIIKPNTTSISRLPEMIIGSKISDDGNLLLNESEKNNITDTTPSTHRFFKKYIGAQEFINSTHRYCIHLENKYLDNALKVDEFKKRFESVKNFRLFSKKESTQKKASTPYFFDEDKYVNSDFILVPQTGSEKREYIPIGYFDGSYVPSNGTRLIYNAEPWIFGIVSSRMHMVWVRAVAGRLKTDMQYSNTLCYNTFPFPSISSKQKEYLHLYVFAIQEEREKYPGKTIKWLYGSTTMPVGLRKAHQELDEAIERCYRLQPFTNDTERLEYLFRLYEEMTTRETLFAKPQKRRTKKQ